MELYSEIVRHLLETGRLPLVSVQPKFDVGKVIQSEVIRRSGKSSL